ncbi:ribonuclease H [Senna tora]|uniref:Ribonuclease H n=1 Tax=Senna tora TaxID=362788 RepID=A0A834XH96_9FABA|nr:ribonuclease H [Senna tora]
MIYSTLLHFDTRLPNLLLVIIAQFTPSDECPIPQEATPQHSSQLLPQKGSQQVDPQPLDQFQVGSQDVMSPDGNHFTTTESFNEVDMLNLVADTEAVIPTTNTEMVISECNVNTSPSLSLDMLMCHEDPSMFDGEDDMIDENYDHLNGSDDSGNTSSCSDDQMDEDVDAMWIEQIEPQHQIQCGVGPLPTWAKHSQAHPHDILSNSEVVGMEIDSQNFQSFFHLSKRVQGLFEDNYLGWADISTFKSQAPNLYNWASSSLQQGEGFGLVLHNSMQGQFKWDIFYVNLDTGPNIIYIDMFLIATPSNTEDTEQDFEDGNISQGNSSRKRKQPSFMLSTVKRLKTAISSSSSSVKKRNRVSFDKQGGCPRTASQASSMRLMAWNCRGFGCTTTIQRLKQLLRQYKPSFIYLSETKRSLSFVSRVLERLGYTCFTGTNPAGRTGGTFLAWTDDQYCNILEVTPNWIHLSTLDESGKPCLITFVYGFPYLNSRHILWNWFIQTSYSINKPWIAIGDFNHIRYPHDKISRSHRLDGADRFNSMIQFCNFTDLNPAGTWYTWTNGRGSEDEVWARLDRALCSDEWLQSFPPTNLLSLPVLASDHSPLVLNSCGVRPFCKRPFRFENLWLMFDKCSTIVNQCWNMGVNGSPSIILHEKLNFLRGNLRMWNKREVGNIQEKIKLLTSNLQTLQSGYNQNVGNSEEKNIRHQLEFYLDCEEALWAQKARQTWLVSGDRCTAYFHNLVKKRRIQNQITAIKDENEQWIDDYKTMEQMGIKYFNDIFTQDNTFQITDILKKLEKYDIPSLQQTHLDILNKPFTIDECHEALNQMKLDSAPGPDGFTVRFYRTFWDTVKSDVQAMLSSFLNNGNFTDHLNRTFITLIPKTNAPQTFKDFRPISLANVSLLITKILCNRLKFFLPEIIAPNQSAFLKGRLITENIILATELMQKIRSNKKGKKGWCALKVDIRKAYHKLSWNFIEAVLRRMNFPQGWIGYIMQCITSVKYQLLFNGGITDMFEPSCGIRQGDPISPYIYILSANVLSCMIRKEERAKLWKGIKLGQASTELTHLMYADDLFCFFEVNNHNCEAVKRVLQEYDSLASQQMNLQKSFLVFSPNIPHKRKKELANFFNLRFSSTLGKYLGTWIDGADSKKQIIQDTIAKIDSKLKDWKARLLSQAGRKIESLMSNFFWGHNGTNPKIHLQKWTDLCKPKEEGGLGLYDVRTFNEALLAKHIWRMIQCKNNLIDVTLTPKYMDSSSGSLSIRYNSSWRWKSIMNSKDIIMNNLEWQIGSGSDVNTNHHAWWPMLRDHNLFPKVMDLIQHNSLMWNTVTLNRVYDTHNARCIASIHISVTNVRDKLLWKGSNDGEYSVRQGYKMVLRNSSSQVSNAVSVQVPNPSHRNNIWRLIWRLKLPYRIVMFMWRVLNNNLPTFSVLNRHHMPLQNICNACNQDDESLIHVFLQCNFASAVWFGTHLGFQSHNHLASSMMDWFHNCILSSHDRILDSHIAFICVVLHVIWRCRNLRVMEGKHTDPIKALHMIYVMLDNYSVAFTRQDFKQTPMIPPCGSDNRKWTNVDFIPSDGISIISTYRKLNDGTSARRIRRIFIRVQHGNDLIMNASYSLLHNESLDAA